MKNASFRIFLSAILSVWILSSCTIEEEFVFNEDFSGTHSIRIDFQKSSELGGPDVGGKMIARLESDTPGMEKMLYKMDSIPGISNAFFETEENAFSLGYTFERLELVDAPMGAIKGTTLDPGPKGYKEDEVKKRFELVGNELHIISRHSEPKKDEKQDKDEEAAPFTEMMEGMQDKIEFKTTFKFKNPIKKVKNGDFELSKDKKTLTNTYNLDQDPNAGKTTVIKFK